MIQDMFRKLFYQLIEQCSLCIVDSIQVYPFLVMKNLE